MVASVITEIKVGFYYIFLSSKYQEALNWIKEVGFESIIIESDALLVVNALRSHIVDASILGLIVFLL